MRLYKINFIWSHQCSLVASDIKPPSTHTFFENFVVLLRYPLQWRHNGRDRVSNHQPHDCLLDRLFRRRSKKNQSSASLAFVRGIHRGPGNSPHKWPVTRKMFPFDDVIMGDADATARRLVTCDWNLPQRASDPELVMVSVMLAKIHQ